MQGIGVSPYPMSHTRLRTEYVAQLNRAQRTHTHTHSTDPTHTKRPTHTELTHSGAGNALPMHTSRLAYKYRQGWWYVVMTAVFPGCLTPRTVRFAQVGCCYHRLTPGVGFPLSQRVRAALGDDGGALGTAAARHLASHGAVDRIAAGAGTDSCYHAVFCRAALEVRVRNRDDVRSGAVVLTG